MTARYQKNLIPLGDKDIEVYATPKISAAFELVTEDMNLIKGVKLAQVLEAVYEQGKKDGARSAFDALSAGMEAAQKAIPHKNPGKPKGPAKPAKKAARKPAAAKPKSK